MLNVISIELHCTSKDLKDDIDLSENLHYATVTFIVSHKMLEVVA